MFGNLLSIAADASSISVSSDNLAYCLALRMGAVALYPPFYVHVVSAEFMLPDTTFRAVIR